MKFGGRPIVTGGGVGVGHRTSGFWMRERNRLVLGTTMQSCGSLDRFFSCYLSNKSQRDTALEVLQEPQPQCLLEDRTDLVFASFTGSTTSSCGQMPLKILVSKGNC